MTPVKSSTASENLCWDVEFMLKRKVTPFWKISRFVVMPTYLSTIGTYWLAHFNDKDGNYQKDIVGYPSLLVALEWTSLCIGLLQVLIAICCFVNPEFGPQYNRTRFRTRECFID